MSKIGYDISVGIGTVSITASAWSLYGAAVAGIVFGSLVIFLTFAAISLAGKR